MEPYYSRLAMHVCEVCNKQFGSRIALQRHSMVHSGERPYTCSFCRASFRCSSHLKRHERLHTGERPYPCSLCSKRYADSTSLLRHAEAAHARLPYPCGHCDRAFSLERELRTHLETAHEIFLLPANGRARTLCENLLKRKSPPTTTATANGEHDEENEQGEAAPNADSVLGPDGDREAGLTSPPATRPSKRRSPTTSDDSECPNSIEGVPLSSSAFATEGPHVTSPLTLPLPLPVRSTSTTGRSTRVSEESDHDDNNNDEDEEGEEAGHARTTHEPAQPLRTNRPSISLSAAEGHLYTAANGVTDKHSRLAPTRQRLPSHPASTAHATPPAALPVAVPASYLVARPPPAARTTPSPLPAAAITPVPAPTHMLPAEAPAFVFHPGACDPHTAPRYAPADMRAYVMSHPHHTHPHLAAHHPHHQPHPHAAGSPYGPSFLVKAAPTPVPSPAPAPVWGAWPHPAHAAAHAAAAPAHLMPVSQPAHYPSMVPVVSPHPHTLYMPHPNPYYAPAPVAASPLSYPGPMMSPAPQPAPMWRMC